jgi:splicing factor 3B subunit 4
MTEELVWELFTQAGPVGGWALVLQMVHRRDVTCLLPTCCAASSAVNVYMPKDRVTNAHQGYGFVEFRSEEDADYVGTT